MLDTWWACGGSDVSMCVTSGMELCVTDVTVIGNSGGELSALDVEGKANSGGELSALDVEGKANSGGEFVDLEWGNSGVELRTSTELLGVVMTTTGLLSLVVVCEVKDIWLVVDTV